MTLSLIILISAGGIQSISGDQDLSKNRERESLILSSLIRKLFSFSKNKRGQTPHESDCCTTSEDEKNKTNEKEYYHYKQTILVEIENLVEERFLSREVTQQHWHDCMTDIVVNTEGNRTVSREERLCHWNDGMKWMSCLVKGISSSFGRRIYP
jgi:hypothetical protein